MKPKSRSKAERLRDASYAEGGKDKMFPEQAANPQRPGVTAHDVKGSAPGARTARGGPKNQGYGLSLPAQPGRTAPARLGKGR
jgi:hypothetical protein